MSTSPGSATPSPPLSRSQPLLGSFSLSLLNSRMSHAHAPHSLPSTSTSGFSLHLGALGKGKSCPPELRCPPHFIVPFSATYYDLEHPGGCRQKGAAQSPWVGTVDLEKQYIDSYKSASHSSGAGARADPPAYPGYRVAPTGQLQILIKTPQQAVKVFLIPYDLRNISVGGRMLARERTYVTGVDKGESLRYAFQLQFLCMTAPRQADLSTGLRSRDSSTTRRRKGTPDDPLSTPSSRCPTPTPHNRSSTGIHHRSNKAFYVSKTIKVVFASSAPDKDESVRTERKDEIVFPSSTDAGTRGRVIGFSPGSGSKERGDEWETIRRKWSARREMESVSTQPSYTSPPLLLPILSPVPLLPSLPSRPTTPTRESFGRTNSPQPPSVKTPTAQRYRLRRGSGSFEERELSERLRELALRSEAG